MMYPVVPQSPEDILQTQLDIRGLPTADDLIQALRAHGYMFIANDRFIELLNKAALGHYA